MIMRALSGAKRSLALILTLMLLLTLLPTVALAGDYEGHWATGSIEKAVQMGWFAKTDDDTYRPNDSITRAEFVTMVNRMKGFFGETDLSEFSDVKPDDWYYGAFSAAVAAGYLTGSNGRLNPTANISRNEAVTIFARISGLDTASDYSVVLANVNDAHNIPDWAKPYAGAAISNGLIAGSNGNFNGNNNISRAETAVLLERLYDNIRVYAFAGTYGPETGSVSVGSVIVQSADVTLRNMNIAGNVTIAEAVGDGDVSLDEVEIGGKLDVRGGGSNSIYIKGGKIAEVIVTKDAVHVVMSDGTVVTHMSVDGGAPSIELGNGVSVGSVTVTADAVGAEITLDSGAKVTTVTIDAPETSLNLQNGASVTTLNVGEDAAATMVNTASGSSIDTVNVNAAGTEITGAGSITTANIKAADVVVDSKPTTTNVDSGLSANVGGSNVTGSGSTSSGGGGGSGGGGSGGGGSGGGDTYYWNVTFDGNGNTGGSAPANVSVVQGQSTALPGVGSLVKSSYVFLGWNTTAGATTALPSTYTPTANVTLYAVWVSEANISSASASVSASTSLAASVAESVTASSALSSQAASQAASEAESATASSQAASAALSESISFSIFASQSPSEASAALSSQVESAEASESASGAASEAESATASSALSSQASSAEASESESGAASEAESATASSQAASAALSESISFSIFASQSPSEASAALSSQVESAEASESASGAASEAESATASSALSSQASSAEASESESESASGAASQAESETKSSQVASSQAVSGAASEATSASGAASEASVLSAAIDNSSIANSLCSATDSTIGSSVVFESAVPDGYAVYIVPIDAGVSNVADLESLSVAGSAYLVESQSQGCVISESGTYIIYVVDCDDGIIIAVGTNQLVFSDP